MPQTKQTFLKRFIENQKGIFWVTFVGITTIMIATGVWLIAMLVTGQFIDTFSVFATGPYTIQLGETMRNEGAILIVVIDVGMVVWMAVSAFRKESQETQMDL